ncbi:MAG: hypothetical protein WD941_00950 [Opitutus sp.]
MASQLTADDARQSLTAHVAAKGAEINAKYGPEIGWSELRALLNDRAFVRYPCELRFDAMPLQPGEFAHAVAKGESPGDGFIMHVHPVYMSDLPTVPALVLYQLVAVNYGEFASAGDAEAFGAAALGMDREDYYILLCNMADRLGGGGEGPPDPGHGGGCSGCCTCA